MNKRKRQQTKAVRMILQRQGLTKVNYSAFLESMTKLSKILGEWIRSISETLNDLCTQINEAGRMALQTVERKGAVENGASCVQCRHYLGGGLCAINEEAECREGGGFELWNPISASRERNDSLESD